MRLVIDTNVVVSALLHPGRVPDRALAAILSRGDVILFDERIATEYRTVLGRRKFQSIAQAHINTLIDSLLRQGQDVGKVDCWDGPMIDAGDRPFVEVAVAGLADALVTGNLRHYPSSLSFDLLSPADLLARFAPSLPSPPPDHP